MYKDKREFNSIYPLNLEFSNDELRGFIFLGETLVIGEQEIIMMILE